jgi:hypothetical protein
MLRHPGGRLVDWQFSFGAAYILLALAQSRRATGLRTGRLIDLNHPDDRIRISAQGIRG